MHTHTHTHWFNLLIGFLVPSAEEVDTRLESLKSCDSSEDVVTGAFS